MLALIIDPTNTPKLHAPDTAAPLSNDVAPTFAQFVLNPGPNNLNGFWIEGSETLGFLIGFSSLKRAALTQKAKPNMQFFSEKCYVSN